MGLAKAFTAVMAFGVGFGIQGAAAAQPLVKAGAFYTPGQQALTWRNIGPFRGGRATAGVGVPGDSKTYYMGATGGGVFKTEDSGKTWRNISDDFFATGSIGDIAVYAGDPSILYVGTGEAPVRGQMSSYGDGVYKSLDAGKTWTRAGLEKTRQISRVVVHPTNPNLVYVAAQGDRWTPTDDRGIYRSDDGGKTWKRILFSSRIAGASELVMDPSDPNTLYAAFWDHQRSPWEIRSGGPGSGIWKTTDGGTHWTKLTKGLPPVMGKIRLAVAPSNTKRIYAAVESEKSGLFLSDDAGATWSQVNDGEGFATRPWYYLGVTADPKNPDTVYVSASSLIRSDDAGKTFKVVKTGHTDTHTLWINPADPKNMIGANDGGAEVSFNAGATWSPLDNQSTAQMYAAQTDRLFPYNVYGGQQDSGPLAVQSQTLNPRGKENFKVSAGGESARFAFDPDNPRVVFGSTYLGALTRLDTETGLSRNVSPWPGGQHLGVDASQMAYRFNWASPMMTSPFDPKEIYQGGNVLFRSTDQGVTWAAISPDLTRNDPKKHGRSGLWWHDGSGGEIYNDIYAVAEAPTERGVIWVGTDDGLVQVTRDDGKTWKNVTPPKWGEGWVYTVEPSAHEKGVAYVAMARHRQGDYAPYLAMTRDYGKTWTDIGRSLPQVDPARAMREDPVRPGMLYAATEYAVWVSFDNGATWKPLQQNLPHVPISDINVHDTDLIVATEGRGFWIMDDISTLRQMGDAPGGGDVVLYKTRDTYRLAPPPRGRPPGGQEAGPTNPVAGAVIRYSLPRAVAANDLKLEILDTSGAVIRAYPEAAPKAAEAGEEGERRRDGDRERNTGDKDKDKASDRDDERDREAPPPASLPTAAGLNQFAWDFRAAPVAGGPNGPLQPSGAYTVRLSLGAKQLTQPLRLVPDPRTPDTAETERDHTVLAQQLMELAGQTAGLGREVRSALAQARDLEDAAPKSRQKALGALIDHLEQLDKTFRPYQPRPGKHDPGGQMVLTTGNGPEADIRGLLQEVDGGVGPVTSGERLRLGELQAQTRRLSALVQAMWKRVEQWNVQAPDSRIDLEKAREAAARSDGQEPSAEFDTENEDEENETQF